MTHRLNLLLLALALIIGLPYYWLFLDNPSRHIAPQPVSMAQLRTLATSLPGAKPEAVEMALVGWRRIPGNLLAAGAGMKRHQLSVVSFLLPVPDAPPIVIDTGISAELARSENLEHFAAKTQQAIDRDLREAGLILATQEGPQQLGGLAALSSQPNSASALSHAKLNAYQLPGSPAQWKMPWPPELVLGASVGGERPMAVAPGVVIIPTHAPTPGSQMIYVQLHNGTEYLFAGGVAPYAVNFLELRVRSRWLEWFGKKEDRAETMRWLVTLRALQREAPKLNILPGQESEWIADEPKSHTGVKSIIYRPRYQNPVGG